MEMTALNTAASESDESAEIMAAAVGGIVTNLALLKTSGHEDKIVLLVAGETGLPRQMIERVMSALARLDVSRDPAG